MSVNDGQEFGDLLSIRRASELLHVPTATIRSWERRYEIPCVNRTSGGHRRYTTDELAMLQHMRDAIAAGHRATAAAALVKAAAGGSPQSLVYAFLRAAEQLQPAELDNILNRAQQALGLNRVVDEVLLPAMRHLGLWWRSGRCDIAHEHLATEAVRAWLAMVIRSGPRPLSSRRPILLACGPLDGHTLGLECMAALLSRRGCDCRVLGARTPAASLAVAMVQIQPAAVIIVSHVAVARRAAVQAVGSAADRCPAFYAGAAFSVPKVRENIPGTYLGEELAAAADLVVATVDRT